MIAEKAVDAARDEIAEPDQHPQKEIVFTSEISPRATTSPSKASPACTGRMAIIW